MSKPTRKSETNFMKRGQLSHGARTDVRLFRNNVGQAWQGKRLKYKPGQTHTVKSGDVILSEARPVTFGLAVGSHDLIGIKAVVITPDMVGNTIGQLVSIETKTLTGRKREEQINWNTMINHFGGRAGFARTAEDFNNIIDGDTNHDN